MTRIGPNVNYIGSNFASNISAITGRVAISILFFVSAYIKIRYPEIITSKINESGLPYPHIGLILAIALELFLPMMLIIGFKTKNSATVLIFYSLITAVFFHNDFSDQGQLIQFLKNIAICGGLLQIISFGGGSFSLDSMMAKKQMRN